MKKVRFRVVGGTIETEVTPDLATRLMEMAAGATMGWLQIAPDEYLQVNQIITWKVYEDAGQ